MQSRKEELRAYCTNINRASKSKVTVVATDFFAVMADLISGFLHYLLMASLSYIKPNFFK